MQIDKISTTIFQLGRLSIKMHIKVFRENQLKESESVIKVFNINDKNYMKIEPQGFLTIDLKSLDNDWEKGILINDKNLVHVLNGFKVMTENMKDPDLYGLTKSNQLILYADQAKHKTVSIFNIGGQQKILLVPTVVYDENEQTYEGCQLIINNTENYIDLTIDAIESIYYTLSKVDIFMYTAQLFSMYLMAMEKTSIKPIELPSKSKKNFLLDRPRKEEVLSNLPIEKEVSNDKFFGVIGGE